MTQGDYEFSGLMAQFWDLLRGDTSRWADRFFYLDVIAQAIELLQAAGFANVHLTSGFSFTPAAPEDTLFCVFGTRPRLS